MYKKKNFFRLTSKTTVIGTNAERNHYVQSYSWVPSEGTLM